MRILTRTRPPESPWNTEPFIERCPVPMAELAGPTHLIRHVNAAFCRLVGKSREALIGRRFAETVQERDRCLAEVDRVYRTGAAETYTEIDAPEPHPPCWFYTLWPLMAVDQRPVGVMVQVSETTHFHQQLGAINRELMLSSVRQHELLEAAEKLNDQLQAQIAQRKQAQEALQEAKDDLARLNDALEHKVQERTAELREALGDLQHMSYSMVHDMRAPLRGMQGFASILEEDCAGLLPPQGLNCIRIIQESANRLDRLVTDALNYSGIARQEFSMSVVDIAKLLRGMLETYPHLHPATADVRLEFNDVVVRGNESLLTQCFGNLLDNAVKFVDPNVKPCIRIWEEHVSASSAARPNVHPSSPERFVRVWVEDNGIGIPQFAQEQIFRMFQRMHLEGEYPGTGTGLAIVRKAVERMNGRVGVESQPGTGSRFWIELPAAA